MPAGGIGDLESGPPAVRLVTARTNGSSAVHLQAADGLHIVRGEDGRQYVDLRALLEAGEPGLDHARRATSSPPISEPAEVLRPVREPGAVICVGLNYRSHILEMKRELPTVPTWFSKLPRALTDPSAPIAMPTYSDQLDYEAELGVIIGDGGRNIPVERAWASVAGLTVFNDITVRDWQWRTKQWFAGKTGQGLTPVGPAMVTVDEFPNGISDLRLTLSVNGELRQDARLGDLVFGVPELIADASRIFELRPGDMIATGTPGGVGAGADSPRWLKPGDVVETSIDGIGVMRNAIVE